MDDNWLKPFDFVPKFLIIGYSYSYSNIHKDSTGFIGNTTGISFCDDFNSLNNQTKNFDIGFLRVSVSTNTIKWWVVRKVRFDYESSSDFGTREGGDIISQLNDRNIKYTYIAIG